MLSLWKVDDQATALLMQRFYENMLGSRKELAEPMSKAQALQEAKRWLRSLSVEDVDKLIKKLPANERGTIRKVQPTGKLKKFRPFEHPYYWAAFILIGDPN